MPKNKIGGKGHKRGKNAPTIKHILLLKEKEQEYALVQKMLGNNRIKAIDTSGYVRVCTIRGKMHKKVWIAPGDVILISLRDYQDDKADVIHKYSFEDTRLLMKMGDIPDSFTSKMSNDDIDVDFEFSDQINDGEIVRQKKETDKYLSDIESSDDDDSLVVVDDI